MKESDGKNKVIIYKTEDGSTKIEVEMTTDTVWLSQKQMAIAQEVGVARPDNIRIKLVERLPLPQDPVLASAALETGFFAADTIGMTLFYGIFVCHHANESRNLIAHECRHVRQYEQKGSIAAFLKEYLSQIVTGGYANTFFELDATRAAREYT